MAILTVRIVYVPGLCCTIKQLKIKWEYLQPSVLRRIFLQAILHKSTEGGLKSIGNTMTVRKNLPEHRAWLQKFSRNLKLLYATGPRSARFGIDNSEQ